MSAIDELVHDKLAWDVTNVRNNVAPKDAVIRGVYINITLTGYIDFFETSTNGSSDLIMRIPASCAGSFHDFYNVKMLGGLRAVAESGATGNILIIYRLYGKGGAR